MQKSRLMLFWSALAVALMTTWGIARAPAFAQSCNSIGVCQFIVNSGSGGAARMEATSAAALETSSTNAQGVHAQSSNSDAVFGGTQNAQAPLAGVKGFALHGSNGIGVHGVTPGTGHGVRGTSQGHGVFGTTGGLGTGANAYAGVFGTSTNGTAGLGVKGKVSGNGTGVWGDAGATGYGVFGQALGGVGYGVYGYNNSTGYAIYGLNNTGGYAGYFNQNIYIVGNTSTGSLTNRSDVRMKKEITDSPYGLGKVLQLRPVTYRWKSAELDDRLQIGLIAQDLQKALPELVRKDDGTGMLAVNYVGLVPVLIKAMQEQQATIMRQEARLARLERGGGGSIQSILLGGVGTALAMCMLPLGAVAAFRRRRNP
jgi:hypothetical protein